MNRDASADGAPRRERAAAVARVLAQISAIAPLDAREAASIDQTARFLATSPHPFSEQASTHHVTASGFVVSSRGVLLHRHRRLGVWLQPGGHVEPGEDPEAAARREIAEETGVPVTAAHHGRVFHVDVHPGPRGHTHYDLRYLYAAAGVDPTPGPGESAAVAWFDFPGALATAAPDLGVVLAALARRGAEEIVEHLTGG